MDYVATLSTLGMFPVSPRGGNSILGFQNMLMVSNVFIHYSGKLWRPR